MHHGGSEKRCKMEKWSCVSLVDRSSCMHPCNTRETKRSTCKSLSIAACDNDTAFSNACNNGIASLLHATTISLHHASCNIDIIPQVHAISILLPLRATTVDTPGDMHQDYCTPYSLHTMHRRCALHCTQKITTAFSISFTSHDSNVVARKQSFASTIHAPEPVPVDIFHLGDNRIARETKFISHLIAREVRPQCLDSESYTSRRWKHMWG